MDLFKWSTLIFIFTSIIIVNCTPQPDGAIVVTKGDFGTDTPNPTPLYDDGIALMKFDIEDKDLSFQLPKTYMLLTEQEDSCFPLSSDCVLNTRLTEVNPEGIIPNLSVTLYETFESSTLTGWIESHTYDPLVPSTDSDLFPKYYDEVKIEEIEINGREALSIEDEGIQGVKKQATMIDFDEYFVEVRYANIGGDEQKAIEAFQKIVETITIIE